MCARRVLNKLKLDKQYQGVVEADGEHFEVSHEDGAKPFKAFLDTGLRRTTTGSRIFGALKGAADGGVLVPHSESRFPGYDKEEKSLDSETLRKYIFGGHVAEYMEELKDDDEEAFKRQFSSYVKLGIEADDLEDVWKTVHANIRADPTHKPTPRATPEEIAAHKKYKQRPRNLKQREDRVKQKKAAFIAKLEAENE